MAILWYQQLRNVQTDTVNCDCETDQKPSFWQSRKFLVPVIEHSNRAPGLKGARLVTIRIEGMACQFCAKTVRERSEALPQVIQAMVHLEDGKAAVIIGRKASPEALLEAIRRAGFGAQILSVENYTP